MNDAIAAPILRTATAADAPVLDPLPLLRGLVGLRKLTGMYPPGHPAIAQRLDLALLRISGSALPTIKLGDSSTVHEGQMLAFTGYPIGMVLGLHPVTHRAMVSSITPVVMPGLNSRQLDVKMINRLRSSPYDVFQLDGTAYPGNSGSPLYDPNTGLVYGVVNMVFVKGTKETALAQPSGITYAIPGKYIHDLMRQEQLIK